MSHAGDSLTAIRRAWFERGGATDCTIHERGRIGEAQRIFGPAVIESFDSTIVVPPRWTAQVDGNGFVRMERAR